MIVNTTSDGVGPSIHDVSPMLPVGVLAAQMTKIIAEQCEAAIQAGDVERQRLFTIDVVNIVAAANLLMNGVDSSVGRPALAVLASLEAAEIVISELKQWLRGMATH